MMTDPVADMLTRVRNGVAARHVKVDIPASNLKAELARVLKDEGYIQDFKHIADDKQGILRVFLKRLNDGSGVISGIKRVSRPGCRVYVSKSEIPRVRGGIGINILSTSRGLMTGRQAIREGFGGEILADVW